MKNKITRIWSVALIIVVLAGLMVAAPASARVPLTYESYVLPSPANVVLANGLSINDFAVADDGTNIYAVGTPAAVADEGANATIGAVAIAGVDAVNDVFDVTYVNQAGLIRSPALGTQGTITIPAAGAAPAAVIAVAMFGVDTSIDQILNVVPAAGNDIALTVPAGTFTIASAVTATGFGTYTTTAAGGVGTWVGTGAAIYNPRAVYKSMSGGARWANISANTGLPGALINSSFVAIAPDDPDIVAIGDAVNNLVFISTNAGATWGSLGALNNAAATTPAFAIFDLDISAAVPPGVNYVAVCGNSAVANAPALYYYNLGAAAAGWRNAVTDFTGAPGYAAPPTVPAGTEDTFWALDFSKNFSADYTAVLLGETVGVAGAGGNIGLLALHVLSFNQLTWDAFAAYPYSILPDPTTAAPFGGFAVRAADIVTAPDYVGSDDVSRVTFTGCSVINGAAVELGGMFRADDSLFRAVIRSGVPINSVDFNGTDLVAGEFTTNIVWHSADPLTTIPTATPSRTNKRIGIDSLAAPFINDATIVKYNPAGEGEVFGAKMGVAAAFSKSLDNGLSWNDIALISTALTFIWDIYATPDSSKVYFVSNDAATTSVFRQMMGAWQRVLTLANTNGYILRGADSDPDIIYVADSSATVGAASANTAIFYSSESGDNRWFTRSAPAALRDLAAESTDVCYIATGNQIRKSNNSGFTWDLPVTPELSGSPVSMINSLSEDRLIVSSLNSAQFSWSTDGGQSWVNTKPFIGGPPGAFVTYIAASGLDSGDYIYAVQRMAGGQVWRWTVGDPPSADYKTLTAGPFTVPATDLPTGIVLIDGVLYISCDDPTAATGSRFYRTLMPDSPGGWMWSGVYDAPAGGPFTTRFNMFPYALKVTKGASNYIWMIDTFGVTIRTYWDTLVDAGPAVTSPADGYVDKVNPELGFAYTLNFQWNRPSENVRGYALEVYTDPAGLNRVVQVFVPNAGPFAGVNVGNLFAGGTVAFEWVSGQTYYWRVRVDPNAFGAPTAPVGGVTGPIYSAWSEMRTFRVEPSATSVPQISSPQNGSSTVSKNPAFSWNPVTGSTMYEFELSETIDFASPLVSVEIDSTGYQPDVTLTEGKTYFWRVRATEPIVGEWSTIANFTVAVPAPSTAPEITVEPAQIPDIVIPEIKVPEPQVIVQPAPAAQPAISQGLLLAIIIIGAVLVIALIVLIVRTRRTV